MVKFTYFEKETNVITKLFKQTKVKITFKANNTYLLHGAESFLRSYLVLQLIKKFPAFYGTRKFITVLTSACSKQKIQ